MYQKIPSPPQKKKKNSEIQIVTIYFFIKKFSLVFPCFLYNKNVWMYQSNFQTNRGRDQHKIKAEFIGGHFMFRTGELEAFIFVIYFVCGIFLVGLVVSSNLRE